LTKGASPGPDGRARCDWALGTPEMLDYHDRQWGRPLRDDTALFEMLTLEAFQSGLSWLTILRKRDGFHAAFDDFDIETVAGYKAREVKRLMADAEIVRNRAKIEATIANAGAIRDLQAAGETLTDLLWGFAPDHRNRPVPKTLGDLKPTTPESKAMAKELKRRGFAFVGPTTAYSLMEAAGLVNDHLAGCAFRELPAG
jgi:DNA-3-methyladenine glycosylase I